MNLKKIVSSIKYAAVICREQDQTMHMHIVFMAVATLFLPILNSFMGKRMVECITHGVGILYFAVTVFGLLLMIALLELSSLFASYKVKMGSKLIQNSLSNKVNERRMTISYEKTLSAEFQKALANARSSINKEVPCVVGLQIAIVDICMGILGLLIYLSVLSSLHWSLAIVVIVSYMATYFINIKFTKKLRYYRDLLVPIQRKTAYIVSKVGAIASAKDMRVFRMHQWLFQKYGEFSKEKEGVLREQEKKASQNRMENAMVYFLRDSGTYLCLVYMYINGKLNIADFVFFVSLVATFSDLLSRILNSMQKSYKCYLDVTELMEFMSISEERNNHERKRKLPANVETIELQNVSYHYPGSGYNIIKSVNLRIRRNEKIGIVGINGAGKTTLALLICGLLVPTEGRILLNGIDIKEFDSKEYIDMFSAVFQEISVLPMSIAENISLGRIDGKRLESSVSRSGLTYLNLEKKFIREIFKDAVSLSGGEMQKLALARAIYKQSKVLILDEPTASLDPLAEQSVYNNYKRFSDDKISLFISHRLASTLFCDRIIMLEEGKIIESGSYDELMDKGGRYKELFSVQRRYYEKESLRGECL